MKVYTKTGDDGTTSLIGGQRVDKCDLRVEAYGTVDELTAFAALLTDRLAEEHLTEPVGPLRRIISQLMNVAALLATGDSARDKIKPIDTMQATLPPITKFTIPGGHTAVSLCHVCRTVCRRAERAALRADRQYGVDRSALQYLNRLSDYFYVLGRKAASECRAEETLWIP